jgi:2-polyprenyl-6-methoxyphenol hydroxylase-like FAD-dependent oxidoreductase
MPAVESGDRAFECWKRPSVPQWNLPHSFAARSRQLLAERAPDVLLQLRQDGIEDMDVVAMFVPPELQRRDDAQFLRIKARRPAFELALRRSVEAEGRVRILSPATVSSLIIEHRRPLHVRGVRLVDGSTLLADVVLDCGGRRSRVPRWLADAGVDIPSQSEDCQLTYFSRYFRRRPQASTGDEHHRRADLGYVLTWTFVGDHDTCGVVIAAPPWDGELKVLRYSWAWEVMARAIPGMAPWLDSSRYAPLHDVKVMAGNQNTLRRYMVDSNPCVRGMLSLGDALSTTNPTFGWGASMALSHAVAALDALTSHAGDVESAARAYYGAIDGETEALFRHSAGADRVRSYRWRGMPVPDEDIEGARRADILKAVLGDLGRDHELLRAFLRHNGLLEAPDAFFSDATVIRRAGEASESRMAAALGPDRDEALRLLAAARPK